MLLTLYEYLFPSDAATNGAIIFRNAIFVGLIILAIAAMFRRSRGWLLDRLWLLRFFVRENRWDRKVKKRERDIRWRRSFEEIEPTKPLSEYERFDDGQPMWAHVKRYIVNQTGVYDKTKDCIAYPDRAAIAYFREFVQYGKYRIEGNEAKMDGPAINGPAYRAYLEENHAENLARVQKENEERYYRYRADGSAQIEHVQEARKIVLCKQFLDNVFSISWNLAFEPEGCGEMFRKELISFLKKELKTAKQVQRHGG